jgi:hypothetical protein
LSSESQVKNTKTERDYVPKHIILALEMQYQRHLCRHVCPT